MLKWLIIITIKGESKENGIKIYCSSRGRHASFNMMLMMIISQQ